MGKYSDKIKDIANELTREELLDVMKQWYETQERWDNTQPGGYYMEWGWDNELFSHQIMFIDPVNRKCDVMDHSVKSHPVKTIDHLPKSFPDEHDAVEYYQHNIS